MNIDPNRLLDDFLKIAELADVNQNDIKASVEVLPAPHTPPTRLPIGKMAVYVFIYQGLVLKVGKVGPKSQARYTSQHYNPNSSRSNLAKSLVEKGSSFGFSNISERNVTSWIKENTDRYNFIISASSGKHVLSLLEAYLQCRLKPVFEGFASQK